MNIEQLNQQIVINEWQLGQQLNTAVQNGTRDKFNLLLSLLSDDVRDFAQFTGRVEQSEVEKKIDLRAYFDLPKAQPLVNTGPSANVLAELNSDLHNNKLTDIRFKQLLANEALLSKQVSGEFPDDVLDNLPLLKKQRVNAAYQSTLSSSVNDKEVSAYATDASSPIGMDVSLLDEYKNLDLENKPLRVHYA
ncbi:VC2046/SO_2500 family protein [uncultured Psychromonas sp.]|uniref:VC2046/SO_2500 family protein n=1 Tax=uncultured Psychromonas sp. TaxID=173974 RepID=UPI002639795D|nr:VC2046/SO_2500 family protein [uncultured Psychromonas sp.]